MKALSLNHINPFVPKGGTGKEWVKVIVVTFTKFSSSSKKPGSKAKTKRAEGKGNFKEEFLLNHILLGY